METRENLEEAKNQSEVDEIRRINQGKLFLLYYFLYMLINSPNVMINREYRRNNFKIIKCIR